MGAITARLTLKPWPAGSSRFLCDMCGSLVGDTDAHIRWHSALLYHSDPTRSTAGVVDV